MGDAGMVKLRRPPSWLYLLGWGMSLLLVRAVWITHQPPAPVPVLRYNGDSPFDWDGGMFQCHTSVHRIVPIRGN